MNRLLNLAVAGICIGVASLNAGAAGAGTSGNTAGSSDSLNLEPGAKFNESYAKKAKEDFERQKKRVVNQYDYALLQCAKQSGQAKQDCKKQAKADFNKQLEQEKTAYQNTLQEHRSSGGSGNKGSSSAGSASSENTAGSGNAGSSNSGAPAAGSGNSGK